MMGKSSIYTGKTDKGPVVLHVAGTKFKPGDGNKLYSMLRESLIGEAEHYAKKQAAALGDKEAFSAIFIQKMDELTHDWLRPLLMEAAGYPIR
jgi:hypothetical protein